LRRTWPAAWEHSLNCRKEQRQFAFPGLSKLPTEGNAAAVWVSAMPENRINEFFVGPWIRPAARKAA
jgi:hypothetical protein